MKSKTVYDLITLWVVVFQIPNAICIGLDPTHTTFNAAGAILGLVVAFVIYRDNQKEERNPS